MRHITFLYGESATGKSYLCQQAGWLELTGTPEEVEAALDANTDADEIGIPLYPEDENNKIKRAYTHSHAKVHNYIIRYIDLRII